MRDAALRRTLPKGVDVFREGEYGDCAYVIERGEVEITTKRGGERIVIARRGEGEIFGEMAIVDNKPRSATVTTATECEFLILSADHLTERLNQLDPVLKMVLGVILERFRSSLQHIQSDAPRQSVADIGGSGSAERKLRDYRAAIDRLELEQELRHAIRAGQLELFFQPIMRSDTYAPAGFEGLVRWRHPTRGLLAPGAFIAAAEDSGAIRELSAWVVGEACRSIRRFRDESEHGDELTISVNVTAQDMAEPHFLDQVILQLDDLNVPRSALMLEVTESAIISDIETTLSNLSRCRAAGVKLAIDDFGTGYSSLSYLTRYPVHVLKIDKSFVDEIPHDSKGISVVNGISGLAHELGLTIVAEGVESMEQAATLAQLGCDKLQGYGFGKPATFADSLALLKAARAEEEAREIDAA